MKRFSTSLLLAVGLVGMPLAVMAAEAKFVLSSPELQDGGNLPSAQFADSFGCSGNNLSPALQWAHAPAGTKSYVLTAYDPDAPTGSGWWHWVIANLPASVDSLATGAGSAGHILPAGAVAIQNDARQPAFLGACPPAGEKHRYIFTLHALKVEKLELPDNASPALVGFMTHFNQIAETSLTVWGAR